MNTAPALLNTQPLATNARPAPPVKPAARSAVPTANRAMLDILARKAVVGVVLSACDGQCRSNMDNAGSIRFAIVTGVRVEGGVYVVDVEFLRAEGYSEWFLLGVTTDRIIVGGDGCTFKSPHNVCVLEGVRHAREFECPELTRALSTEPITLEMLERHRGLNAAITPLPPLPPKADSAPIHYQTLFRAWENAMAFEVSRPDRPSKRIQLCLVIALAPFLPPNFETVNQLLQALTSLRIVTSDPPSMWPVGDALGGYVYAPCAN